MSMRLTVVVPIIAAACAGAALISAPSVRAQAECLAASKGAAPEGRHWYYRTDRSTGKRCWCLAAKNQRTVVRQGSSPPTPSPRPDAEPTETSAVVAAEEAPPAR